MLRTWTLGLLALVLGAEAQGATVIVDRSFSQNLELFYGASIPLADASPTRTFELPDLLPAPTFGPELLRIDISGTISLRRTVTLNQLGLLANSALTQASAGFAAFDLDFFDVEPVQPPIDLPLSHTPIATSRTLATEGFACNFGTLPRPACPRTESFEDAFAFAFSFPAPFIDIHEGLELLQGLRLVFDLTTAVSCGAIDGCEGGTMLAVWEGAVRVAYVFEDAAPVPEPSALALFGIGVLGLGLRRRASRYGSRQSATVQPFSS